MSTVQRSLASRWRHSYVTGNSQCFDNVEADGEYAYGEAEDTPVNEFETTVARAGGHMLCEGLDVIQVNVGLKCNQQCSHCHVSASPTRREMMLWGVMERVVEIAHGLDVRLVDITGGSPELNCELHRFISTLRDAGRAVQVRTNLTVLTEPGMEEMAVFLRAKDVALVASMPCYLEENVCAQRGEGVYQKSIDAMRMLNSLGYGEDGLQLDLVYNPGGPFLPGNQETLEADYRRELNDQFGITFSHLLTITNLPIGRFAERLKSDGREDEYLDLLRSSFNPATMNGLMCRHQLSVGWDGTLYDCDFNLALDLPVDHGAPNHISRFDAAALRRRRIVTREHCFGCTAGSGSSCGGALA